jgi:hypothetical protein
LLLVVVGVLALTRRPEAVVVLAACLQDFLVLLRELNCG